MLQTEIPMNNNKSPIAKKGRLNKYFSFSNSFQSSSSIVPSSSPMHSTSNKAMVEENIENAELIITEWDISIPNSSSTSLFQHRKQAKEFLKCLRNLRRAMHFLISEHSASNKLVLAQNLMGIAMKRLETGFHLLLSSLHDRLHPVSVSVSASEVESSVPNLKLIADCMISSGYSRECVKIYTLIRKSATEKGLYLLGVEKYRFSQIQKMNWEAVDNQITNWINAVKITAKTLFAAEKSLCDYVFSASQTIRECCFTEITKESATNLFKFPQLIANCKKSPERIFSFLELHQTLCSLQAEIEFTFNSESTSAIRLQVLASLQSLRESVCVILSGFVLMIWVTIYRICFMVL